MAGFVGKIVLTPSGDEWFETEVAPALVINKEGDFDTFAAQNANAIGTVWNAWETQWSGVTTINLGTRRSRYGEFGHGYHNVQRSIDIVTTGQKRTGTQTSVGSRLNEESLGTKVISRGIVPFVRPRTIEFAGSCFAPNTRLYVFFDRVDVSVYCTPSSSLFTIDTTIAAGSTLITTGSRVIEGSFAIPDYKGRELGTVPFFRTGEVEFRLTSSNTDVRTTDPATSANAYFEAKGMFEQSQNIEFQLRPPPPPPPMSGGAGGEGDSSSANSSGKSAFKNASQLSDASFFNASIIALNFSSPSFLRTPLSLSRKSWTVWLLEVFCASSNAFRSLDTTALSASRL